MHLAVHSWQHGPLHRVLDLIDIALMSEDVPPGEVVALANAWQIGRIWGITTGAIECLLRGHDPPPWPLRTWARHLRSVRERRAVEARFVRWFVGPFGAPTPGLVARSTFRAIRDEVRPWPDEPWPEKLGRMRRSLRDALIPESENRRRLG